MTELLWGKGDVVVTDSKFCSLHGIYELLKKGVCIISAVKKKRYWPRNVCGEELEQKAKQMPVGTHICRPGQIISSDKTVQHPFYVLALRDTAHIGKFVATCGTDLPSECVRRRVIAADGMQVEFVLPQVLRDFYSARHAVDDNNHLRQGISSIEAKMSVHSWPLRQLLAFFSISEVNALCAHNFIVHRDRQNKTQLINFRRQLAQQLIEYCDPAAAVPMDAEPSVPAVHSPPRQSPRHLGTGQHRLETMPKFATKWDGRTFGVGKNPYNDYKCRAPGCGQRTRTYCSCNPAVPFCRSCFYTVHLKTF
jgi:hypothetical protein